MSALPLFPVNLVNMAGSVADIIFSFLAMRYAYLLSRRQRDNFLWGFLFYFCMALSAFSVSRAVGHIVKQFLLMAGDDQIWAGIAPYSGGVNTLLLISVSAVTLFYNKSVQAYEAVEQRASKLKNANLRLRKAAAELQELNLHLEDKVEERTFELSKSEKKFRHLFSNSKDMIFFGDTANNLLEINESGLEMLGYGRDKEPHLNLYQIFHNEDDVFSYYEMLDDDGYIKDFEAEFQKKDGSIIYVLISATAIYNDDHCIVGCEGIAKDLTRVKTMTEQLVANEKMVSVGQMAAGVAHEINTPLGIILGYTQLMKDDFAQDSEAYENLSVIERQTRASRKIVADLLKFSRQSGGIRMNINLNDVLRDVIAVTEHNINLDHIKIHVDLAGNLPEIVGDAEKLRQVFVNLLNNAGHAMEGLGGGDIFITTYYDGKNRHVIARLRDTGQGISEEVKVKIFEPFFTTKPVGKGTGLGLSVSYGIIKNHGGIIEVESPALDQKLNKKVQGTAFTIVLPCAEEADVTAVCKDAELLGEVKSWPK